MTFDPDTFPRWLVGRIAAGLVFLGLVAMVRWLVG